MTIASNSRALAADVLNEHNADGTHSDITADSLNVTTFVQSEITLVNTVDEFSTDGTMTGDSDDAVPTEKAVKAYVDAQTHEADTDEKAGIDSAATAGYIGAASSDGIIRVDASLDYTDGGDYVTIGIDSTLKTNYDAASAHVSANGTSHTNVGLNDSHRGSNGTDHSYVDQSVVSGATPTFTATNITGTPTSMTGTNFTGIPTSGVLAGTITTGTAIPNGAGGTTVDAVGEVCVDSTSKTLNFHDGTAEVVLQPIMSKGITIESPADDEDIAIGYMDEAVTITKIVAILVGSDTPSVTWTLRHGTDRSAAGAEAVTGGTATTSVTTGEVVTGFNDATVVADSFLWVETTAQSGTVTEINLTIFYKQDA